jgi:hypothetical protein
VRPAAKNLAPVLAPLLRLLDPDRARIAHAAVSEGIGSVEPLIKLWLEETRAAEGRARLVATDTRAEARLAQLVEDSLRAALAQEEARWNAILRATLSRDRNGMNVDALVSAFGHEGPIAHAESFDTMMRDPAGVLELSPSAVTAVEQCPRDLAPFARRATRRPIARAAWQAFDDLSSAPERLTNGAGCGTCLRGPAGDAVVLGDGTAVTCRGGRYAIEPVPQSDWQQLSVFRLASGLPPVLAPSARAALASCLVKRNGGHRTSSSFASNVLLGATLEEASTPTKVVARVAQLLRDLADIETPDAAAAVLLEIAFLVFRVHVLLTPYSIPTDGGSAGRPIDVGRVRWCMASDSPRFWIPIGGSDPDLVGGADRPWTRDIPAAGAQWQANPSALQLDPSWHARIVVQPGDCNLWCVDSDGVWWSLESDFDAVLLSRRKHLEGWLAAVERFSLLMPEQINKAREKATVPMERGPAKIVKRSGGTPESNSRARGRQVGPQLSKSLILELAGRYSYSSDDEARAAGGRAALARHYSRRDFLAVVRWKSARTLPLAEQNSASAVARTTRAAFLAHRESERMARMLTLRGVGVPVASALLHFAFPDRYPILDFRALSTLGDKSRRTQYTPSFWAGYVNRCRSLAERMGVSIRDLDKALWQYSRETSSHARRSHTPRSGRQQ